MLNGLDLFSGIGGVTVALSEWVKPVAYCEAGRYAQAVLLQRMRSADIPEAPIWDDVRTLQYHMLPEVDIIYGGFPCQDISVAGLKKGMESGVRSGLFSELLRLVHDMAPTFIFLENVAGIRTKGLDNVVGELTSAGYDARWLVISAASVGAPHLRKRWFLLAHSDSELLREQSGRSCWEDRQEETITQRNGYEGRMADPNRKRCDSGVLQRPGETPQKWQGASAPGFGWWASEPSVGRVANGIPARVDRVRGLGNAVVPQQAKEAFMRLMGREDV